MDYIRSIPFHMDYVGQSLAEKLSRLIISVFGLIGLLGGYFTQQFSHTVYILSVGFIIAAILTIPPWPMYRRHPLKWQPARDTETTASTSTKNKKKK